MRYLNASVFPAEFTTIKGSVVHHNVPSRVRHLLFWTRLESGGTFHEVEVLRHFLKVDRTYNMNHVRHDLSRACEHGAITKVEGTMSYRINPSRVKTLRRHFAHVAKKCGYKGKVVR
jgi:hypothetical protein